ncbi:hypothetical protein Tco_0204363 [Tanacetum coccineum]
MEATVDQCSVDKNVFEIQIKQLRIDNDQLLNQIMSQEIMHIVVNYVDILDVKKSCMNNCSGCLELEIELFKKKDFIEKEAYNKLVKSYSNLEKHCISLELATQLNQDIFQRENSGENLNAPTFNQLFEINELKAQSQEKDTIIRKLKERIKSLSGKDSVENVKKDIDEIETINIELEHSVAKLLSENENLRKEREHLKSIYKDQFDSIRKTRVQSKEHCDSLIAQINAKSLENSDLNAQLQEKVFANAALKNELSKLKGKMLKNNRNGHEVYIEKTIEYADTLCRFVKRARTYEKLVVVTPINKDKRVRFAKPVTSSNNIPKQTDSLKTKYSNKPLLTSTGVIPTTSASGSKPSCNTKNNRISRPPRSNQKNKIEDHPRKVKSSLNKTNYISEPITNALVKRSVRNAKFEYMCAICNKCLFDANHDMCLIDFVNDVNVRSKSKSKRNKKKKAWKPTGCPDLPLVSGLRMFKTYDREPLSAHEPSCALGKSKKSSHQPKAEETNQEKLYRLHMDLCALMHMESINGKKYILLMHDKKPNLSFFHVFGSLCYPTNDSEDLGKLNAKADIGLVQNIIPQQPCNPPKRDDWDTLFQPLFDEYFNPPTIDVSIVPIVAAPRLLK